MNMQIERQSNGLWSVLCDGLVVMQDESYQVASNVADRGNFAIPTECDEVRSTFWMTALETENELRRREAVTLHLKMRSGQGCDVRQDYLIGYTSGQRAKWFHQNAGSDELYFFPLETFCNNASAQPWHELGWIHGFEDGFDS